MKSYYIGIDLGGTNTKVALLGERYNILKKVSFPTALYTRPQRLLARIVDTIINLLKAEKISRRQIKGIGIGIAGLVDTKRGLIHRLVNIPGWSGIKIKKLLEGALHIPTYADNDVNAMTLAELHKGAGKNVKNLVCVTLGTGVGGGIVIDGKLYRGSTSSAGEIGHIPINEKGPRCNCGGIACIEAYVGNRYFINEVARMIKKDKKTVLRKMAKDASLLTPEMVYRAARGGDKFAIEFWKKIGTRIGIALTGIINLLDPDRIVIGGGVAEAGRFLFPSIQKTVEERAMEVQRRHVKIVKARLGKDAGLIGAAILTSLESKR